MRLYQHWIATRPPNTPLPGRRDVRARLGLPLDDPAPDLALEFEADSQATDVTAPATPDTERSHILVLCVNDFVENSQRFNKDDYKGEEDSVPDKRNEKSDIDDDKSYNSSQTLL